MKQKKKKDTEPNQSVSDDGHQQTLQFNGSSEAKPKKSALKRTGTSRKASGSKNKRRVQFNESKNTFFESDYVIVIRDDDCDFDEEDFDFWSQQPCSCGDSTCFQPWVDDQNTRRLLFDPYEEQPATLSPPDGYKDGCPRHVPSSYDHHICDDELTATYNSDVVNHCYNSHSNPSCYTMGTIPSSYSTEDTKSRPELTSITLSKEETLQPIVTTASAQSKTTSDTSSNTTQPRCIVETITMTTVTERQIVQETRNSSKDSDHDTCSEPTKTTTLMTSTKSEENEQSNVTAVNSTLPPDEGYVIIRCGNNTMIYNNQNPNSAVRQLFPSTKFVCPPTRIRDTDDARLLNKYLITEDSLRAFDSRSLNGYKESQSDDDDDTGTSSNLIRRTIERSTLRRNMSGKKKNYSDSKEISLIEKIRRLTCESDDDQEDLTKKIDQHQDSPYTTVLIQCESASATTHMPIYTKLSEVIGNSSESKQHDLNQQEKQKQQQPSYKTDSLDLCDGHVTASGKQPPPPPPVRSNSSSKPFLTSLATACVSGNVQNPSQANIQEPLPQHQSSCPPQPDVVVGTQHQPSISGQRHEESVQLVQQDTSRLDKIRKRYLPSSGTSSGTASAAEDEDDENDDYGFNRRPEVHGIRPGFSAQIMIKNQPPQQRPGIRPIYYSNIDSAPDFVPRGYSPIQPLTVVRTRAQGERPPPPSYPAATAQRSIIRVTHGQHQTIRVPYQAVGPVQVHLLTTAAAAAAAAAAGHPVIRPPNEYIVHQHGHARIQHGQQFVIARGTQTAAISTTRYYQLPPPPPSSMQQSSTAIQDHQHHHHNQQQQPMLKQTSPTRNKHATQDFVDHNNMSSVNQTPPPPPTKNPVMFYGMNV
ncbi:uncharacterized protein LOC126893753 [Daktulosphaira vitifoliae]|uniref:uncharacterized protein LOC126893753 n=1 Tax=Daktulosphaira vitifoliae TaxID=58002 RepID=UPI0021AACC71|nr:uncharacterized protein LOC126893753 [Daktulosphaira vitifoliae]